MNHIIFTLLRRFHTRTQWLVVPIYRLLGKQIIHFIHCPKTGGTSVKQAIISFGWKTRTHYFCLYDHNVTARHVWPPDIALITRRDEEGRQRSVYYARKWKAKNYSALRKWYVGITKDEQQLLNRSYDELSDTDKRLIQWMKDDFTYYTRDAQCKILIMPTEELDTAWLILKAQTNIPEHVNLKHYNKRRF